MNYYELLNIGRDADANAVKRAYFSAVKVHSPDKDPEGFKAVRLAYETLSDQKKRSKYDSYFVLSSASMAGEMQNKLLAAREMIRENRYKQAADYLTGLIGNHFNPKKQQMLFSSEYPEEFYTEARRLFAEVIWHMKKSGTAKKICEQLLERNPSDAGTLHLLAKINVSMGHTDKARGLFNDAANAAPSNSAIWIDYMSYALVHAHDLVIDVYKRAMEQNIDMFRDKYVLYLAGLYSTDSFSGKEILQYREKFIKYFVADKAYDEEVYNNLFNYITHILYKDECIPFLEKILPILERNMPPGKSHEELFKEIREVLAVKKLNTDKRIHAVLNDMTIHFLSNDTNKDELFQMEFYIVSNLSELRPSIKVLMNEYPEFFKLNRAFYLDVLNEKKETNLIDKYIGMYKKQKPSSRQEFYYDDDDDEEADNVPFVRSSPKTGRNDPCPCGSGKKYKKCCGR